MKRLPKKAIELVVDVHSHAQLKTAVRFGAGAIVLGQKSLISGQRWRAEELETGILFAHQNACRVFLDLSGQLSSDQVKEIKKVLLRKIPLGIDALLISNEGLLFQLQGLERNLPIHFYCHSAIHNIQQIYFWKNQGVERLFMPPLSNLLQITQLIQASNKIMDFELQLHGPLNPLNLQDIGDTSILYSERLDLCTIQHIPALIKTGAVGFRIVDQNYSQYDLAILCKIYRQALDTAVANPKRYRVLPQWQYELEKIRHQPYSSAAYWGAESTLRFENLHERLHSHYETIGKTLGYHEQSGEVEIALSQMAQPAEMLRILDPHLREILTLQAPALALKSKKFKLPCATVITPNSLVCRSHTP
jgi:putative protease